jgi:hypothetical protein
MDICDRCHEEKESTCWRNDPYEEDVNGKEVEIFVCDQCDEELADEI